MRRVLQKGHQRRPTYDRSKRPTANALGPAPASGDQDARAQSSELAPLPMDLEQTAAIVDGSTLLSTPLEPTATVDNEPSGAVDDKNSDKDDKDGEEDVRILMAPAPALVPARANDDDGEEEEKEEDDNFDLMPLDRFPITKHNTVRGSSPLSVPPCPPHAWLLYYCRPPQCGCTRLRA